MYKVFGKREIVKNISGKINNSIQTRLLNDIIEIISNFMCDEIISNRIFSVSKFGTFTQATRKARLVWSNAQDKKVMSKPRITVKFIPHVVFTNLLESKRKNLIDVLKTEKSDME